MGCGGRGGDCHAARAGAVPAALTLAMAIRLTKTEIQLLKELKAVGKHGRHIAGISSAIIAHLLGAQYVQRLPGRKHYAITERGRQALSRLTDEDNSD
jgi:hypothetical protein